MRLAVFAVSSLTLLGGCSTAPAPLPAGGKVTVKGQPAAGALVAFHSKDPARATGPVPLATAGDDGTYALSTGSKGDGALPGDYGVTVVWHAKAAEARMSLTDGGPAGVDRLGGRYGDPRACKLNATVAAGTPNRFDFNLD